MWSTADRVPAIHVLVGAMLEFAEPNGGFTLPAECVIVTARK